MAAITPNITPTQPLQYASERVPLNQPSALATTAPQQHVCTINPTFKDRISTQMHNNMGSSSSSYFVHSSSSNIGQQLPPSLKLFAHSSSSYFVHSPSSCIKQFVRPYDHSSIQGSHYTLASHSPSDHLATMFVTKQGQSSHTNITQGSHHNIHSSSSSFKPKGGQRGVGQ